MRNVSWDSYLLLSDSRGDKKWPRMAYLDGELELMSPSSEHELIVWGVGFLVALYCVDRGLDVRACGSPTLLETFDAKGIEPDVSFSFGRKRKALPDLAIEIEWTRSAERKLDGYSELGIREVWRWRRRHIRAYQLERGQYVEKAKSRFLPELDLDLLSNVAYEHLTLNQAVRKLRRQYKN